MPNFNNLDDLISYLDIDTKKALKLVANDLANKIRGYINREWYQKRTPSPYYDRTMEFLNNMRVRFSADGRKGQYSAEIFFGVHDRGGAGEYIERHQFKNIRPHLPEAKGHWSKHASIDAVIWNGNIPSFDNNHKYKDVSEAIPIWIDKGIDPDSSRRRMPSYEGINYVDEATRLVNNLQYHLHKLEDELTKKGYIIKIESV